MTKADANIILNAARAGWPVPQHAIDEALRATGDLEPNLSTVLARSEQKPEAMQ